MRCHGGPTVTPEKNCGWGARSGCFRATPGGAFGGCRPSRGQEGTPPVRPPARRFVLVVLGNGGADITGPSTRAAMIHGTVKPPWRPPDAIQATHRQPARPGKLRGLAPKSTPKPHSSKYTRAYWPAPIRCWGRCGHSRSGLAAELGRVRLSAGLYPRALLCCWPAPIR